MIETREVPFEFINNKVTFWVGRSSRTTKDRSESKDSLWFDQRNMSKRHAKITVEKSEDGYIYSLTDNKSKKGSIDFGNGVFGFIKTKFGYILKFECGVVERNNRHYFTMQRLKFETSDEESDVLIDPLENQSPADGKDGEEITFYGFSDEPEPKRRRVSSPYTAFALGVVVGGVGMFGALASEVL